MRRALTAILLAAAIAAALVPGAAAAKPSARPVGHVLAAPANIRPVQPVAIGDNLVLAAFTRREGRELYVSDGTARGTRMIESIAPGRRWPVIGDLTPAGGHAFFSVCRGPRTRFDCRGATGRRLWVTDGTARGTHPVSGAEALDVVAIRPLGGDRVSVAVADPGDGGPTVWISDGTADGTWHLAAAGTVFRADMPPPVAAGGALYFATVEPDGTGRLWRSDEEGDNAQVLADVYRPLVAGFGDGVLVLTGQAPRVLFAGPGDPPVVDLGTLSVGLRGPIEQIVVADGLAYISWQAEVWRVDGTPSGTQLVATTPRRFPHLLGAIGSAIVFVEQAPPGPPAPNEVSVWVGDGTADTTMRLAGLGAGSEDNCGSRVSAATPGRVWFRVKTRGVGCELWSTDGTPHGTALVRDIARGRRGSAAGAPVALGKRVYFWADDRSGSGRRLWVARSPGR